MKNLIYLNQQISVKEYSDDKLNFNAFIADLFKLKVHFIKIKVKNIFYLLDEQTKNEFFLWYWNFCKKL